MGLYGSGNFKILLLLQITAKSFQTSPEFSFQWFSQNYINYLRFFEILSFRFLTNVFLKIQIFHCSLWRNQNLNYRKK